MDSGGVANVATIGGTQFVNQGGVASASLQNGGAGIVLSGGTTIATVFAGGALILSSGVIELGNVIFVGSEVLSAGASDAVVFGQGEQIVAGGTALETTVRGGGTQAITQAGTARNTFVSAFGVAIVSAGGVETNATIFTGRNGTCLAGRPCPGRDALRGRFSSIGSGGTAIGTTLLSGAEQDARGASFDALVLGGTLYATSGGLVTSAVVSQGGFHRCLRRRHFARSDRVPGRRTKRQRRSRRYDAERRSARTSTAAASRAARSS